MISQGEGDQCNRYSSIITYDPRKSRVTAVTIVSVWQCPASPVLYAAVK